MGVRVNPLNWMLTIVLLASVLMSSASAQTDSTEDGYSYTFGGFYESWLGRAGEALIDNRLANLPRHVNMVMLAFMKPDSQYQGSLNLAGTGLEFSYDGITLKRTLRALKARNPQTKILISVGGAEYDDWSKVNASSIAQFVNDFELDGVDIDFEPENMACTIGSEKHVLCTNGNLLTDAVNSLRSAMPRPRMLTLTAFHVGAYGEGRWRNAKPTGFPLYGYALPFLQSEEAGNIDLLGLMAYDAGKECDPLEAYLAYRKWFEGPILIGVSVPPESWGGHIYSVSSTETMLKDLLEAGADGAFLWSLQKKPTVAPDKDMPDAAMLIGTICRALDFPTCDDE